VLKQVQTVQYDWQRPYLDEVQVLGKTLRKGQIIKVNPRPGLIAGDWVFKFAEYLRGKDGDTLVLHIEGPIARETRHKSIRVADVKAIKGKSRRSKK
jgi:hypothetical protein